MKKIISVALILVMCVLCLAGCGKGGDKEGITIKWYLPLDMSANNKEVLAKVAEKVYDKLGVNLEIGIISMSDYDKKIQVMNAAMEDMDIVYTSSIVNNYYTAVDNGRLLALDDYLETAGADMYKAIPEYMWDATRVDGKIYAVPNQQIVARGVCFWTPAQNVELLEIDPDEYLNAGDDYKSQLAAIEKYLRLLKEKTGTYTPISDLWGQSAMYIYGFDNVLGQSLPGAVNVNAENPYEIVNQYKSEEFKYYITKRNEWVKDGLIQPERDAKVDYLTYLENGQVAPEFYRNLTYMPGLESSTRTARQYEPTLLIKTKPLVTRNGIIATMNAVCAQSKNPEAAVKVLNLINTDKEIYNLLAFGIEGEHYEKVGENKVRTVENSTYSTNHQYAIGNSFNLYVKEDQPDDVWEQTKALNDNSERSPLLGFSPSTKNITLEIAACQAVLDQYMDSLIYGTGNTQQIYDNFIEKLDAAGVDKIVAELQKQVDAWRANQ